MPLHASSSVVLLLPACLPALALLGGARGKKDKAEVEIENSYPL
jgi:hypothetical protein